MAAPAPQPASLIRPLPRYNTPRHAELQSSIVHFLPGVIHFKPCWPVALGALALARPGGLITLPCSLKLHLACLHGRLAVASLPPRRDGGHGPVCRWSFDASTGFGKSHGVLDTPIYFFSTALPTPPLLLLPTSHPPSPSSKQQRDIRVRATPPGARPCMELKERAGEGRAVGEACETCVLICQTCRLFSQPVPGLRHPALFFLPFLFPSRVSAFFSLPRPPPELWTSLTPCL